jgi:hypothetical protein
VLIAISQHSIATYSGFQCKRLILLEGMPERQQKNVLQIEINQDQQLLYHHIQDPFIHCGQSISLALVGGRRQKTLQQQSEEE